MTSYIPTLSEPAQRWLRFFVLLLGTGVICWLAYGLRGVFTPVLIGAAIAYVLNPIVTWFTRRYGVSRLMTVTLAFSLLAMLVLSAGLFLGSQLLLQLAQFQGNIDRYYEAVLEFAALGPTPTVDDPAATAPATAPTSRPAWLDSTLPLIRAHGVEAARTSLAYVIGTLSNVANLASLLVLAPLFTFYFLWRFDDVVRAIRDYLPARQRPAIVHAARTIDAAMASFFRGRLIVCLIVGTLTWLGWSLAGVPYSLPLGVLAGVLNLVPFMSMLALPPAMFFTYFELANSGGSWALPVAMVGGVYLAIQALESFVLSPMIEGQSSGLHPLVIVVALMIGAQWAGLLGMLLAIPVASTLRTFAAELLMPEIQRLAGHESAPPPTPAPVAGTGFPGRSTGRAPAPLRGTGRQEGR